MLHLAICDDEPSFVEHLRELLDRYAGETGEEIKVTSYRDGEDLTAAYDTSTDLIFLDINMRRMDGLTAAERVRRMDTRVGIIFLTTLPQYSMEGYQYQALSYILKPVKYARLRAELDRWRLGRLPEELPSLVVANDTGRYKIFFRDLRYVETFNRNLLLHAGQEEIVCYKSMKEMEKELCGGDFVRCHTSYIVNLFFVKRAAARDLEVELVTGERLPVSQPRRKEFMERLAQYMGERL